MQRKKRNTTKAELLAELAELRRQNAESALADAERKRAVEALAHERNLLRTLIDNLPDYIYAKDSKSCFVLNNAAHLRLLDATTPDAILGKTDYDIFPEELATRYYTDEQEVVRSGKPLVNREEEVVDEQGQRHWLLTTKVPLRDAKGEIVGLVGMSRNITDLKRHEEELRFRKALLESQNEAAIDGVLVVNAAGEIVSFNHRMVQMWPIPEETIATGSDEAALRCVLEKLDDPEGFLAKVNYLYEHNTEESRDEVLLLDGRVFDRFSAPVRDAGGTYYGRLWLFRDLTERKRMEDDLQRHARLIERANLDLQQRNQELDEFTYFASHDLQEPLRKLVAFSGVLEQDMAKGDELEVREDLKILTSAARRMQRLVQDLLALSRSGRQDMQWQKTALGDCVDRALDALELRIGETNAHIQQDPLPMVEGDPSLLAQVYQNLIGNALKFHGEKPPHIKLSAEEAANEWILTVADRGIGIKPDYAKQIFLPFKRLHGRDEYEGTGIGLAICRRIVERHRGRIWVESELGHGAQFRFTIGKSQETEPT